MRRRAPMLIRVAAAMLVVVAWIDGAGLEFQARAMACCTHRHDCGGDLRAPDKCCERMGHAAPAKTGTIAQSSQAATTLGPVVSVAPPPAATPTAVIDRSGFTRPHDPPHLHTFALLI